MTGGPGAPARLPVAIAVATFLLLAATYVVNAMDRIVFPTLLPAIAREFDFPLAQGGFLATVFTLGLGVAGIPSGFLFDRMSRRAVAALGVVIYSACTILTCFSIGFYDMSAYRAVSGIGEALQNAALFTMAGSYFVGNRTLAMGVLNAAYGVGSFIGPRWGAALEIHAGNWREPLYVYGALGLAGAVLTLLVVSRRFTEQGELAAGAPVRNESHVPDRLINRNTSLLALTAIAGGVAGYGYLGLYPTFLMRQLHFTLHQAGAAASMYGAGALLGIVCGLIADRVSQKWVSIAAMAVLAVNGYALFNLAATPWAQGVLSFVEGSAFSGFLYVNTYSLMQRSVRTERTARASGLVVTCVYLPAALSGYLFAHLEAAFGWGTAALIQLSLTLIVPIAAMLFFDMERTTARRRTSATARYAPDLTGLPARR